MPFKMPKLFFFPEKNNKLQKNMCVYPTTHMAQGTNKKKIPVLMVTTPNLKLLAKPNFFSNFLKMYNLMHFERRNAKMPKIFFPEKK